ncbi:MAG TPA: hypothetical protein VM597_15450 [Gemmataceae bacterium]|nr:hypothetical protein [Gemmataceae bacterium]
MLPPLFPSPRERLKERFRAQYYLRDDDVLGVVARNRFDTDPVGLHLISPPSSGKTEVLYALFGHPDVYFLSDLTANALISGCRDEAAVPVLAADVSASPDVPPAEGEPAAGADGPVGVTSQDAGRVDDPPAPRITACFRNSTGRWW